ncbi:MAG: hypothetical protein V2A77_06755 [Pseudomonadota bacterium]
MRYSVLFLFFCLASAGVFIPADCWPRSETATIQAEARVPIAGGNISAARTEALKAALKEAVSQAALSVQGQDDAQGPLPWVGKPEGYISSYRLLYEGKEEAAPATPADALGRGRTGGPGGPASGGASKPQATEEYAVGIEATVSLGNLMHDYQTYRLKETAAPTLPLVVARIDEASGQVSPERAQQMLFSALKNGGFKVSPAAADATAADKGLHVAARLGSVRRGGGYAGSTVLVAREGGEIRAKASAEGEGTSPEGALAAALTSAVDSLAGLLRAGAHPIAVMFRLKGINDYSELAQVKAALEEAGLSGHERSLQPGEVILEVKTTGGSEVLAGYVIREFKGFHLRHIETAPGSLVVEVVPTGEAVLPAAP